MNPIRRMLVTRSCRSGGLEYRRMFLRAELLHTGAGNPHLAKELRKLAPECATSMLQFNLLQKRVFAMSRASPEEPRGHAVESHRAGKEVQCTDRGFPGTS